jgi:glycerol-3-phosphate dehydrogenase (NAD(P)+)
LKETVAVIGNTGWGRTIASFLSRDGHDVRLLARTESEVVALRQLSVEYRPTCMAQDAMEGAGCVVWAVPSQTVRANALSVRDAVPADACQVSVAKGLEVETGKRMTEVLQDALGLERTRALCALSGPNLADEIARGLPAATVVASSDAAVARRVKSVFGSHRFITVVTDDVIGVELAGALKNIVALGAGMMDGLRLGDNAKAAFIAFAWSEVIAFGVALGARESTFYGLAGFGDVVATCVSDLSRNHRVGCEVARGRPLQDVLSSMHQVAEGVHTAKAVRQLAVRLDLDAPIMLSIYRVLFEGYPLTKAVARFTGRVGRAA